MWISGFRQTSVISNSIVNVGDEDLRKKLPGTLRFRTSVVQLEKSNSLVISKTAVETQKRSMF